MGKSAKVISAAVLWLALLSGGAQAQSCDRLCDWQFWLTATGEQVRDAIADEGVTARDNHGSTPLHRASGSGTPETVSALLEAGADVDARDGTGWTPLHMASGSGTPKTVSALLEAGADVDARTEGGLTPFDLARENDKLKGTDVYWQLNDARYRD